MRHIRPLSLSPTVVRRLEQLQDHLLTLKDQLRLAIVRALGLTLADIARDAIHRLIAPPEDLAEVRHPEAYPDEPWDDDGEDPGNHDLFDAEPEMTRLRSGRSLPVEREPGWRFGEREGPYVGNRAQPRPLRRSPLLSLAVLAIALATAALLSGPMVRTGVSLIGSLASLATDVRTLALAHRAET